MAEAVDRLQLVADDDQLASAARAAPRSAAAAARLVSWNSSTSRWLKRRAVGARRSRPARSRPRGEDLQVLEVDARRAAPSPPRSGREKSSSSSARVARRPRRPRRPRRCARSPRRSPRGRRAIAFALLLVAQRAAARRGRGGARLAEQRQRPLEQLAFWVAASLAAPRAPRRGRRGARGAAPPPGRGGGGSGSRGSASPRLRSSAWTPATIARSPSTS